MRKPKAATVVGVICVLFLAAGALVGGYFGGLPLRPKPHLVAVADPLSTYALDDVKTVIGGEIETVVSTPMQITDAINFIQTRVGHEGELADEGGARVSFAHADLSAYSVFEEAFTRGDTAGRRVARALGLKAA